MKELELRLDNDNISEDGKRIIENIKNFNLEIYY